MLTWKSDSSSLRPKHALRSLSWSESLFTPKPSPPPSLIEARTFMVGEYFTLPYRQYSPINVVMGGGGEECGDMEQRVEQEHLEVKCWWVG